MATLAELDALIDANPFAFLALAATYEFAEGGVPTINGQVALINNAAATNFGSNRTDVTFNQENAFINVLNAHIQGNPAAAAKFQAITAGAATLQDKLGAIYDAYVPAGAQTAEGRAFFTRPEAVTFYQNVAAERGVAGSDGAAIVALASLFNILVNQDIGLGDSINDLRAAIADGSAVLPESGNVFTPIEVADGTNFDGDDGAGSVGGELTFTSALGENLVGGTGNDTFNGVVDVNGVAGTQTFSLTDSADGGDGVDTFNLLASGGGAAVLSGTISNVEIVNLVADVPGADTIATPIDAANFVGVQQINVFGDVTSEVSGLDGDTSAAFIGAQASFDVNAADGADTVTVAVNGIADGLTLTVGEVTADDVSVVNVSGSIAAPGGLTIDLDGNTASGNNLNDEDTLTLAITSDGTITIVSTTLETVDASASTGDLTIAAPSAATTDLLGGSGDDTLTGGNGSELISGGAGDDILNAGALADGEVFIGGTGQDDINLAAAGIEQTIVVNAGDTGITAATIDVIAGFATGEDVLDFNLAAGSATNFVDGGASSSFVDALTNANTAFDGTVQYFFSADAANGWVFVDRDLDGNADEAVQLTGVAAIAATDIIA